MKIGEGENGQNYIIVVNAGRLERDEKKREGLRITPFDENKLKDEQPDHAGDMNDLAKSKRKDFRDALNDLGDLTALSDEDIDK